MEFLHFSVVKCDYPVVKHGSIVSGFRGKYYYNVEVVFQCHDGFYLHGSSTVVCGANGTWEPELPKCTTKGMKVSVSFFFFKRFYFFHNRFQWYRAIGKEQVSTYVCLTFISMSRLTSNSQRNLFWFSFYRLLACCIHHTDA